MNVKHQQESPEQVVQDRQEPRLDWVMCASASGMHRMAYWEWGDPHNPELVLCVHGLTGTGRDFDQLARALSKRYRVVAPDIVGRGKSDWLVNADFYTVPQYAADITVLLARLQPSVTHWVGTSMGGLTALALQSGLQNASFTQAQHPHALGASATLKLGKLVLNDVGPMLDLSGVQRIGDYLDKPLVFDSYAQAKAYLISISSGAANQDEHALDALMRHLFVERDGQWHRHYDNRMAQAFIAQAQTDLAQAQALLWGAYQSWPSQILVLRGTESDILGVEQLRQMRQARADTQVHEIVGVGHAPSLRDPAQITLLDQYLKGAA